MKNNKKLKSTIRFLIVITLGIIVSAVGVYAATIIGKGSNLTYDNTSSNLSSTNIQDALDELKSSLNCPEGKICIKTPLKLGDYISMTPTKSSYKIDTSKMDSDDMIAYSTINPQKLSLWRVISINFDGTAEIISDETSPEEIMFNGIKGYINFVGYLNVLASQYENSTYTIGSRNFGFNGQTEYLDETKIMMSLNSGNPPWTCSTGESCFPEDYESFGGGNKLDEADYNLVKNALGNLNADASEQKENQKNPSPDNYYISSRYYRYNSNSSSLNVRLINASYGDLLEKDLSSIGNGQDSCSVSGIRPILTLKAGIHYTGLGTKENPKKIKSA